MGVCVETLQRACKLTIEETANTIEGEMKGIVGGHTRSGLALGAIHIEMGDNSAFVGGTGGKGTLHLYFLNDGNGGKMIYPKRARALHFSDGTRHGSARPYKGIHFVEEIASRHGG
jgi:hypothetical protein